MHRRMFLAVMVGGLVSARRGADAQQAARIWRVGFLTSGFKEGVGADVRIAPFSRGLRELGYAEGRNLVLEVRYAEGRTERFPALAAELVKLKVDVLVATSTPGALAAKQATSTIPIVMAAVGEPVEVKLVESLAHPGGNITGLSISAPQLAAKRLDLLKQTLPRLSRVTVLWNSANEGMQARFQQTQSGASLLGMSVHSIAIQSPDDFDAVFGGMSKDRPESLLVLADTVTVANRHRAIEFAARNRVPAIYEVRAFVEDGGLMSYGIDMADHYRRAAVYVDKIIRGAKPADLPIEQPTKFELIINLKTARALGLTIPSALLMRADQVIE